jgi:choline transport protein
LLLFSCFSSALGTLSTSFAKLHQQLLTMFSDLEKVTNTPTLYPIIEVLYEATGSKAGTVFMMMIIYFVIGCSQFNILASVSRLTW